jgi:hypothetical protein
MSYMGLEIINGNASNYIEDPITRSTIFDYVSFHCGGHPMKRNFDLKKKALNTSETLVNFYQTALRNIPENSHLYHNIRLIRHSSKIVKNSQTSKKNLILLWTFISIRNGGK